MFGRSARRCVRVCVCVCLSMSSSDDEGSEEHVEAVRVFYCGVCGFPPEFCKYNMAEGGKERFEMKCRPWLLLNYPDVLRVYPDWEKDAKTSDTNDVAEGVEGLSVQDEDEKKKKKKKSSSSSSSSKKEEDGGGELKAKTTKTKKKDKPREVVIEKGVRNKKKCITTVRGLEIFGIKLAEASKKLGKKVRCIRSIMFIHALCVCEYVHKRYLNR